MKFLPLLFIFSISACTPNQPQKNKNYFFDLETFFKKEAARLQHADIDIQKKVSQNNQSQQLKLRIANWEKELDLFISSDINKPAWKYSYSINTQDNTLEYLAQDDDLKTRKIQISKSGSGKIKRIDILNKTSNLLYSSSEVLTYIPDSLYKIEKLQNVLIIGSNAYSIVGKFQN